jgi:hypothetical protein
MPEKREREQDPAEQSREESRSVVVDARTSCQRSLAHIRQQIENVSHAYEQASDDLEALRLKAKQLELESEASEKMMMLARLDSRDESSDHKDRLNYLIRSLEKKREIERLLMRQYMTTNPGARAENDLFLQSYLSDIERLDNKITLAEQERKEISSPPSSSRTTQMDTSNLPPPDSQRLADILPPVTNTSLLSDSKLHFVNRDQSMITLMQIQWSMFYRRTKPPTHVGGNLVFPLMDSLFGMGKTSFAKSYLAMVERFVSDERNRQDLVPKNLRADWNFASPGVLFGRFLSELKGARTLYVDLSSCSFVGQDRAKVASTFGHEVAEALFKTFGITLEGDLSWKQVIAAIPKPVFIVLDEIGAVFAATSPNIEEQRNSFIHFVTDVCSHLSKECGVYYILSGKADFLWEVGLRSEFPDPVGRDRSPGCFRRVNLNPIREPKIREILEKTMIGEEGSQSLWQSLQERYPGSDIDRVSSALYRLTGGHPRTLMAALVREDPMGPLASWCIDELLLDVRRAVRLWPSAIKRLFSLRGNKNINLHTEVPVRAIASESVELKVSMEFLATRIHAGIGPNPYSSEIHIMPPILEYLEACFTTSEDSLGC